MSKTLTTKEFIEKYSSLDKPVKIIGEYVNCKTKIKCKCLICNNLFEMTPDCLMQGQIHKPCAMKLAGAKKLSNTESFKEKLEKKPETVIELAVKGMLPKGPLGREMYKKLYVYAGNEHPHAAQKPEVLTF